MSAKLYEITNRKGKPWRKYIGGPYYFLHGMTRDVELFEADNFNRACAGFLASSGQELKGTTTRNSQFIIPVKNDDFFRLFSERQNQSRDFLLSDGILTVHRWPEGMLLDTCSWNVQISLSLPGDYPYAAALEMFRALIESFNCFWGQFTHTGITDRPNVAGQHAHTRHLPPPALANYYGPEYLRVLGRSVLEKAGFGHVSNFYRGVLAEMGRCTSQAEFLDRQKCIMAALGGERLFYPADKAWVVEELWQITLNDVPHKLDLVVLVKSEGD